MPNDEPIYEFPLFKDALRRKGIEVGETGGYKIVRPADVIFKNGRGNVDFQDDKGNKGIFIKDSDNHFHQVFMYKRDYHLGYGKPPKYHICQCQVIQQFMAEGRFKESYRYANTEEVIVQDLDDHRREVAMKNLPLCSFCAGMMKRHFQSNMNSNDFVEILKAAGEATEEESKEVDIFGYVKEWPKISEAKRELENYTCEQCGYQANNAFDRRFIQVHHIDGNKLNNKKENLKCLCIRCHANVDQRHKQNFSKGYNADMLAEFVKSFE